MLRRATRFDMGRILEIRDSVHENPLCDPNVVTEAAAARLMEAGALWGWQEAGGLVAGFAAGDVRDGSIWALLVAPGHDGRGIGRALLRAVCDSLRTSGHRVASLRIEPGTRAERYYRADGWIVTGTDDKGALVFQKPL